MEKYILGIKFIENYFHSNLQYHAHLDKCQIIINSISNTLYSTTIINGNYKVNTNGYYCSVEESLIAGINSYENYLEKKRIYKQKLEQEIEQLTDGISQENITKINDLANIKDILE